MYQQLFKFSFFVFSLVYLKDILLIILLFFQSGRMLWEQELYNQFRYDTPESFFHMFATDVSTNCCTVHVCNLSTEQGATFNSEMVKSVSY